MKITGKTKIVGLVGGYLSHTLSPMMHNASFSFLNMDWIYVPFEVRAQNLKLAIKGLCCLGVVGVNVTIPYKIEVMKYITDISPKAKRIGAVNTLLFKEDKILGFNTDGDGFTSSLESIGYKLKGKNVLLMGAGGAGRAIAFSLQEKGVKKLAIFDLVNERKESLVRDIENIKDNRDVIVIALDKIETQQIDLLINATPQGMKENDPLPCGIDNIHPGMLVYDIIYKKTPLLIEAEKRGAKIMDGSEMLIHQGALSFEIWTGVYPPIDVMREALKHARH